MEAGLNEVDTPVPAGRWTAASINGRHGLEREIPPVVRDRLESLARKVADTPLTEITRADFDDAQLNAFMVTVAREIDEGRGAVVLSGLDVEKLGQALFERIFWGIGTHLGEMAPQSHARDLMGYVRKEENNPSARGYQSDIELRPHTDFHEILGLACVSKSVSGGESGLVSIDAVHDIIARERPDVLDALYAGYPMDTTGDGLMSDGPVPVIGRKDGVISGYAQSLFFGQAARTLGEEVPPALTKALEVFNKVTTRPDVIVKFMLEPGEIMMWHNFRVLHSRDNFQNDETHKRLILRLWINPENHVPVPPVYLSQVRRFDALHAQGIPAIQYHKTGIKI